jgi:hypothetical protein
MTTQPDSSRSSPSKSFSGEDDQRPLTGRRAAIAVGVAILLIVLFAVAIRAIEMVTGQYISNGVPPLPAFAALLILSLLRPVLRRHCPRLAPTRAQILLIYCMLTIAVVLSGLYHVRAFLPHLVALQYWGGRNRSLAPYARYLPSWYAPRDSLAIKHYYEGAPDHRIPWNVWLEPLACWSLFFLAMFLGIFSLVTLVQRQWIRDEKLSFPLLTIPLALTSGDWSGFGSVRNRRLLFLLGFGIAAAFNGINILHILNPVVPAPGFEISLAGYFPDRPWTPLQSIRLDFMLESVGIGYFVPLEITFSTWVFYLLNRVMAVAGTAAGYDQPGFPFTQEQSAGGYVAMGLILLWGLRRSFAASLKQAFGRSAGKTGGGAERLAWIGLFASILFTLGFLAMAGLTLWLSVPYLVVVGLFVLVYARIRAETGVPFGFIYPEGLPKELILNLVSIPQALNWGGAQSLVLFSSLGWLSRFHHPEEQAAYQIDSRKLAEEARIPRRLLFWALLIAFAVGLGAAFWVHLSAYYTQGSNLVPSAGGIGEYRESLARGEYEQMAARLASLPLRNLPRLWAAAGGSCFVCALTLLRRQWIGCPLHPLGFLLATARGDESTNWFPMLLAWLAKATILRIGGLRLYRQGIPFFLGLAIGHFLVGGLFWPVFSLFLTHAAANAYHLVFGE